MTQHVDVAVIDYGMGNLHSVSKALQKVAPKAQVWVGDDPDVIRNAARVVYPGVGAIRDCIGEIAQRGLDEVILEVATSKPILAICVGMQGLMRHSQENGGIDCLDVLPCEVEYFGDNFHDGDGTALKVPHMGWNTVHQTLGANGQSHALWRGIADNARFYFVHSYCVRASRCDNLAGVANYGFDIAAAVARDNIFAVQFHPEKSHRDGLQLLENFMHWDGR